MASRGGGNGGGGGSNGGKDGFRSGFNDRNNSYRRAMSKGGGGGGGGGGSAWARSSQGARANAATARSGRGMNEAKQYALRMGDALDKKLGFPLLSEVLQEQLDATSAAESSSETPASATNDQEQPPRLGWLLNMRACTLPDVAEGKYEVSAVELYFLEQDGAAFKTRVVFQPYFYVKAEENRSQEAIAYCQRRFDGMIAKAERVLMEDLDMPNHLSGKKAVFVKLSFFTVADLITVKQALAPLVEQNQAQQRARQAYELQGGGAMATSSHQKSEAAMLEEELTTGSHGLGASGGGGPTGGDESESALVELREYDVPYAMRVAIDLDIRVGAWYLVQYNASAPYAPSDVVRQPELVDKAEPVVCAWDIETTKAPLKFPDAQHDQIYMVSYMIDRQGYLIVNREFVSQDIDDFEYTPKDDYPGPFIVFNEPDEKALIRRFLDHLIDEKPHIYVTYNGDFFDWPFLDARCQAHDMNLARELGVELDQRSGEYRGRSSVHLDAFCWVKRDSYLPQGSQGLKAVTKYKLGYDPVEVDAEDMLPLARDDPHRMASYSVSDAVATFYLYDKYVHLFVFSLCTIIPLNSEDVLRKGSGTLCEALLMVEAFRCNIMCPNKSTSGPDQNEMFHKGHLVENETYVGGHVECLESGVFRADFNYDFNLVPRAFEQLQEHLDRDLQFAIEVEMELTMDQIGNYDEVKREIFDQLQGLKEKPQRREKPLIYHLDVAAMYPNIILTNRLQPCAIVNEADCAACVHNTECGSSALKQKRKTEEEINTSSCQRTMDWVWRGDYYPASRAEYMAIKGQLEYENFAPGTSNFGENNGGGGPAPTDGKPQALVPFRNLRADRQRQVAKTRLKNYCSSVYKKTKVTSEEKRSATVCMRENPFYVDTVRAFRDRRYEYKTLTKVWKGKQSQADKSNDLLGKIEAGTKALVYDSLQLAHKCILNSFYGYVMRRGARWHSMEMAGIVTNTGSQIITNARKLVEQIGRPLELDTDGIWAILPASFPENFSFLLKDGKTKKRISYPCVMLNAQCQNEFNNPQYHELDPVTGKFNVKKECSILFEVDGPYKAMVLPASTEEGKLLKKRYAVFNFDHSLAELKGFELKRRGELQLIKAFQSQVFECFLDGSTLEECYASVAACANRWLDVIDTRAQNMHVEEVLALLTENKSMSGRLEDYDGQKSTSITTARRLSEFLGAEMIKDKGLTCKMIIASRPAGEKVTERAIPTAIFSAEEPVKRHFLRKWLKDPNMQDFDIRSILDWDYYRGRYASTVQKIISLPAAFQNVKNPVPRIELPDWMRKQVREKNAKHQQGSLNGFIVSKKKADHDFVAELIDLEDLGGRSARPTKPKSKKSAAKTRDGGDGLDASPTSDGGDSVEHEHENGDKGVDAISPEKTPAARVKLGEVDFQEWLANRKSKWKSMLVRRKRQREELSRGMIGSGDGGAGNKRMRMTAASSAMGNGIGMENFVMRNTTSLLTQEAWQIVEIQPDTQAGLFTCWVVTGDSQLLHRITLKVPRVFYIDLNPQQYDSASSSLEDYLPPNVARRVLRVLPHGSSSKPRQVLEIVLSEQQYQHHQKELAQIVGDPLTIAGVYELQVAAIMRAVCSLGCVVRVKTQGVLPVMNSETTYELEDLQFQSTVQVPYLHLTSSATNHTAPGMVYTRRVLLYFAQQNRRAVLGLVVLRDSESHEDDGVVVGEARIWYVDPFSPLKPRRSEMEQLFAQLLQDAADAEVPSVTMQRCEFKELSVVKTAAEAFNAASSALSKIASDKQVHQQTPTIVIAQSSIASGKRLREKIPGLHSFPLTMLPWHEEDALFPALTWRPVLAERMLTRWMEMGPHFQDVLECARYAHVPVGNFSGDHALTILDILYSRMLTKHKHLWWHSTTSLPDLGGREEELLALQQQATGGGQASLLVQLDKRTTTGDAVVCAKGSYVDICVELQLDGLAVNALLVAAQIDSIEGISGGHQVSLDFDEAGGSTASKASGATEDSGDGDDRCEEAFRLLRSMVTNLFKDFLASRNKFADHLLQQFYRWLCSPQSLCYDPALHARVKQLMEKVFLQLLAEFRRLGAQIVFADFSKIVLCTKKSDLAQAQTYVAFIVQTVLSKELFQVLSLTPKTFVAHLFFLDTENYGGVLLKSAENGEDNIEALRKDDGDEQEDDQDDELEIVSHWNIANYLPRGIDDYFLLLVGQFIRRRAEYQRRDRAKHKTNIHHDDDEADDQAQLAEEDQEAALSPLAKYSQRIVANYFSDKLLRIVPEIQTYNMGPESFPVHAGSHLQLESPSLELVKFVSAVFQLEPSVDAQVQKMKRTLLKLLQVSEFADQAAFRNPSLCFAVADVICQSCNLCRSVDLCRDPQLFKITASGAGAQDESRADTDDADASGSSSSSSATTWHCPRCFSLYDKAALEARLVEMVQAQSVQYQLQDLQCRKCGLPAEHKMREYCTCSGTYALPPGAKERLVETLRLLHRVAQQHAFVWLLETVERLELGLVYHNPSSLPKVASSQWEPRVVTFFDPTQPLDIDIRRYFVPTINNWNHAGYNAVYKLIADCEPSVFVGRVELCISWFILSVVMMAPNASATPSPTPPPPPPPSLPQLALQVLTVRSLWQHIVSFQCGLPTLLLQFETKSYFHVLKRARKWKHLYLRPSEWTSRPGLVNGEWLALALLYKRFDVAQCIVDFRQQFPVQASQQHAMFTVGDAARIVAVDGTAEQLQWIDDRSLLKPWSPTLLGHVLVCYTQLPKHHTRRRRNMDKVIRWLVAHHPETFTSMAYRRHARLPAHIMAVLWQLPASVRQCWQVDWSDVTLDDLKRLARDHGEMLRSDSTLPDAMVQRGDLEAMQYLIDNQLVRWSPEWLSTAASLGHLDMVKLLRPHLDSGVETALGLAARNGHHDVVQFLRGGDEQQNADDGGDSDKSDATQRTHATPDRDVSVFNLVYDTFGVDAYHMVPVAAARDDHKLMEFVLDKATGESYGRQDQDMAVLRRCSDVTLCMAGESGNLAIFQRLHALFHPHCCPANGPMAKYSAIKAAARRGGSLAIVQFYVETCDLARPSIDVAVLHAAVALSDETKSYEITAFLFSVLEHRLFAPDYAKLLVCAAKRGHRRVVELLASRAPQCREVVTIDAAVIQAAASAVDEATSVGLVQNLLTKSLEPIATRRDLAVALERAAHRGHQQVVELLLDQGVACSSRVIVAAVKSGNLALVQWLACRFPDRVSPLALNAAVDVYDMDGGDSDAIFKYLHDHHHDRCCHEELLDAMARSDQTGPVWSKLLHLHQHCDKPLRFTRPASLQMLSKLPSSATALRVSDLLGFTFLLCFNTSHGSHASQASHASHASDVWQMLSPSPLSRQEMLHLTLILQRGFASLFEKGMVKPSGGVVFV